MVSANKPLITPADFQGLKFRISGSKVADQYFRQLGAVPQVMAFSEVYQALQTGVVDGSENTASNYLTQKIHEVQKHITIADHAHLQYAVIVNKKFWDGLPADIRAQASKRPWTRRPNTPTPSRAKENDDALAEIKKSGKTRDPRHRPRRSARPGQRRCAPTYAWAEGASGSEVIELFRKATAA